MLINHGAPKRQQRRHYHRRPKRWSGGAGVVIFMLALASGLCVIALGVFHFFSSSVVTIKEQHGHTDYYNQQPSITRTSKSYVSPEIIVKEPSSLRHNNKRKDKSDVEPNTEKQSHPTKERGDSNTMVVLPQNHTHSQHYYLIPNILIFTHYINLLDHDTNFTDDENYVLQDNVLHTISLHPDATVRFLTDEDCITSIRNVMGDYDTPLVDFFRHESQGMFKADICRGAALYETGGLYFDIDIRARFPLWDAILSNDTSFVVPKVHLASKHKGSFFQAFIGSTPHHPFLRRYLELFLQYYQGKLKLKGPLGVLLLRRAHDEILEEYMEENHNNEIHHHHPDDGDIGKIVLWQEVKYAKELFPNVPPPVWGKRRACHMVVVAAGHPPEVPFIVPFYSRVKGSRMCGGKDTNKKG